MSKINKQDFLESLRMGNSFNLKELGLSKIDATIYYDMQRYRYDIYFTKYKAFDNGTSYFDIYTIEQVETDGSEFPFQENYLRSIKKTIHNERFGISFNLEKYQSRVPAKMVASDYSIFGHVTEYTHHDEYYETCYNWTKTLESFEDVIKKLNNFEQKNILDCSELFK